MELMQLALWQQQQWPIVVMMDYDSVVPGSMLATAVVPLSKEPYVHCFSLLCRLFAPLPSFVCYDSGDLFQNT